MSTRESREASKEKRMKVNKYQGLDDAICKHLEAGRGHPTNSTALEEIAKPLLATNKTPFPVAWRLIDRRMQAMRKTGRLLYQRSRGGGHGRWLVIDDAVHELLRPLPEEATA